MIFTRRFGALRARPVFPAVTENDEGLLEYFGDVRLLGEMPQDDNNADGNKEKDAGESAA
jgi:hypothetical protein